MKIVLVLATGLALNGLADCDRGGDDEALASYRQMMADSLEMMRAMIGSMMADSALRSEGVWVRADMMELPEGVPARDLPDPDSPGARLVAEYCSQCHGIPTPGRHSAEDWIPTLRRMFARMDHMSRMGGMGRGMMGRGMMGRGMRGRDRMPMGMHGVRAPTTEQQRLIVEYYQTHALRTIEPATLPTGEGAALFRDRCSRCHALPNPAQHTPQEWPAVVERMRENTRKMGVGAFSDDEATAIVEYLQRAAAGE